MSSEMWHIHQHIIPASHPRGFPRGVRDEEASHLRLSVKQYIPKCNLSPRPGDATLILVHSMGATKESFEPLFDELLLSSSTMALDSSSAALRIRSIWALDIAWHGASFRLNSKVIGDSPHWDDNARDFLQLVNHFQVAMPLPIFAIGQSWGCYTILRASLMHPRLFTGLVAIEPVIATGYESGPDKNQRVLMIAKRRDKWPSREEARKAFLRTPFYKAHDRRAFERVTQFDFVDADEGGVELTTPKAMEMSTMLREVREGEEVRNSELIIPGFYRPETSFMMEHLREISSPCLYVWGAKSDIAKFEGYREFIISQTGTGVFRSDDVRKNRVQETWVDGVGHNVSLEKPKEAAGAILPWLLQETARWKVDEREERTRRGGQLWVKGIDPEWMRKISKL